MRLLIATDNYPPRYDGISRVLQEIVPILHEHHEVHVIAPDFGPTDDPWKVTKLSVSKVKVGDFHPASLHPIKTFKAVKDSDAVFCQTLGPVGLLALVWAKLLRKKTVLYTHSIDWELVPRAMGNWSRRFMPGIIKGIDRFMYKRIDLLLVPASSVSEKLHWNKIGTKRVIIHLGVDAEKFSPPEDKRAAKKELGLEPDSFIVGYHGRLAREKDLKTLLRGYLRFKRRHPERDMKLLIVGDGLREIRQMLERDDVIVTGFVEDPTPHLKAMDVYVMPSLTETTCLSVMEAMSTGLAVISTPVGYVSDYITDGKSGLLFEPQDSVMLSKHLSTTLDNRTRGRLGRAARKSIQQRFSWQRTRDQILSVFDRL